MSSRGSVIPVFKKNVQEGKNFLITSPKMTRFNITLENCIKTVIWTLQNSSGGEIVIRKSPSYKIIDLARAISNKNKFKVIGIRPGEKVHEELVSKNEDYFVFEKNDYFILVNKTMENNLKKIKAKMKLKKSIKPFSYNSETNKFFLSVKQISDLLKKT